MPQPPGTPPFWKMWFSLDVDGLFRYTVNWLHDMAHLLGLDTFSISPMPALQDTFPFSLFCGYLGGLPIDICSQPFDQVVADNQRWFGYFAINILVYCIAMPACWIAQYFLLRRQVKRLWRNIRNLRENKQPQTFRP